MQVYLFYQTLIVLEMKEYTAIDLVNKNLSEIVALMGADYQFGSINILEKLFTIADGSDSALMVYNETTMLGIAIEEIVFGLHATCLIN